MSSSDDEMSEIAISSNESVKQVNLQSGHTCSVLSLISSGRSLHTDKKVSKNSAVAGNFVSRLSTKAATAVAPHTKNTAAAGNVVYRAYLETKLPATAVHPLPGTVIYSATKFAVNGFIQALHEELRQEGNDFIKLTSVLPYFVSTRRDLMEAVRLRFGVLSADEVAAVAVDSVLRNELVVSVPKFNWWLSAIVNLLSLPNQGLIRDHVLRERESRKIFYKEKKSSTLVHG